jgi:hypothetical protein
VLRGVGAPDQQVIDGSSAPAISPVVDVTPATRTDLTLQNLSITGGGQGPGIRFSPTGIRGRLWLKRCRLFTNHGGIEFQGSTAWIADSEIFDNSGSGLQVLYGTRANVERSTFANNSAVFGGGIQVELRGRLDIENSTISGNSAARWGGGIGTSFYGSKNPITVRSCTISGNFAGEQNGGIGGPSSAGDAFLQGSILADNSAPLSPNCGSVVDRGYNLIDETTNCAITPRSTTLVGVDPLLVPLAGNGGPTRTHALTAGSPAIEVAKSCLKTDQRGVDRGKTCSIGAFEFE